MTSKTGDTADVSPSKAILAVLFSVVFLDNLGFAIVLPYTFYYVQAMGGSDFTYGILLTSYSLMSFIFTPIVSRLSDKYGRRRILLAALAVSSLSYFIYANAPALWILFIGRMLAGTTAATIPVAQAYIADVTSQKTRLRYLGLLGAAMATAFILGPALGGTLSQNLGYAVPSFLASGLALANLISAYFKLPEPERPSLDNSKSAFSLAALQHVLRQNAISLLLGVYFLFFTSFVFLQTAIPPWLQGVFGYGPAETGYLFFYIGAVVAVTQAVILTRLSKKISRINLTLIAIVCLTVGLSALSLTGNLALLLIFAGLIPFGFGILLISLTTLISVTASEETQGGTLGLAQSLAALAQTIGPALATAAFAFGFANGFAGLSFAIAAGLSLCTIPLVLRLKKTIEAD